MNADTLTRNVASHTPGPWTVLEGIPRGGGVSIGPELDGIGPHAIVTFNGGESEANAHLIAAAPDLLAVVAEIEPWFEQWLPDAIGPAEQALIERARAAIAKAEGSQP